ncbi:AraC family transcriptional regulator [Paenibacillus mucilaginosus 3016]|uniref:AraC family transcriptional regulator n=1 Tax=Paenibacillus mucilaginosus 3016 TaxID=1116391 RepID=H6NMX9_9BACL|nr:helix-turn-helix domain-containing protein [Paenibacillus mucilaginosus]AFC31019.1 AraC family transcriptional regulator [Paenibacillus mucilaginosus 3016]WFA19608.1 AraC family transcriptional regulator [Paenibacillus mucilaginosus]
MLVRHTVPHPSLLPFVETYWCWESEAEPAGRLPRILPNAECEVLLHYRTPLRTMSLDGTVLKLPHAAVAGPKTRPCDLLPGLEGDQPGPIGIIGIRFRPGAFRLFCRLPADGLTDAILPLEEAWGTVSRELLHRLQETPDWQRRTRLLDDALLKLLESRQPARTPVDRALSMLRSMQPDGRPAVRAVCDALAVSERQLERWFLGRVGLPPKRYARLARFQLTLIRLLEPGATPSGLLPLEYGYYDQSHFLRELRSLAGAPLASFLEQPDFLSFFYKTPGASSRNLEWNQNGEGERCHEAVEVQRLDAARDGGHP